jgi:hypothetical protein
MFKINKFLLENNLDSKFIFIHINENDLENLDISNKMINLPNSRPISP